MGSMIKRIVCGLLLIVVLACGYRLVSGVVVMNENMYLLTNISQPIYEQVSPNTCYCNLGTVSNMVINMVNDGYEIERETYAQDSLDILLQKDELRVRLNYTEEGRLFVICNAYENSYLIMPYINEVGE